MALKEDLLVAREEYIKLIKAELLGPGSELSIPDEAHELISDAPNSRYSIGILYPKESKLNADNDDTARVEVVENVEEVIDETLEPVAAAGPTNKANVVSLADEDNLDEEIGLAAQNMPSSMGITLFAKGDSEKVKITLKFATYRKATSKDCRIPLSDECIKSFVLPDIFQTYFYIDAKERTLRLVSGGVKRKTVRDLGDKDLLGGDPYGIISKMYKLADQLDKGYVRVPHEVEVCLEYDGKDYIDQNNEIDGTDLKITSLRRKIKEDVYSITIMAVNDNVGNPKAENCIYQPEIVVYSNSNSFTFVEYSGDVDYSLLDDEEKSLDLQYRNKKVYATGLGTSAGWDVSPSGEGSVYNDYFPEAEVPSMDFRLPKNSGVEDRTLSMKYLSDLSEATKDEIIDDLKSLTDAYEKWIEQIEKRTSEIEKKYSEIAKKNINGCRESARRMKQGISILECNENAWNAFRLANRAMFMQRAHLKLQIATSNVNRYPDDEELTAILDQIDYRTIDTLFQDYYAWRPFQLAFLLMSVDSIVNDNCDDRNLVDLIWFPTGGGKTEAYLGLTAFTIFYRRLAHKDVSDGTTVIMRYTLRLLAAQQFTRASTLICACEYIRVDATAKKSMYGKYPLGDERITIGLWIGGEHTPNRNDAARSELKALTQATVDELDYVKDGHNKFQVLKCPWCGTKLVRDNVNRKMVGIFGYRMRNNSHFEIFCPQESCFFNQEGSLPVQVVDEELYNNPPTLLFGTVDKFAMLPWNPRIGSFFATDSSMRAPELIIQDELHLISGPLGTMVGLYEAAIDALCTKKGVKTKIIASTATIRKAVEQCASLYDREVRQFPHPGIDAEDSFFARESAIDYSKGIYGRKYVGLMPSGKTKAMMEIRSAAAMLQKINVMDLPYDVKDKYWTLTIYFNSLKDLGKASTLVDDDIKDFIKRMAYRLGDARDGRVITGADELTSRVSTTQLNETLDKLEKVTYSQENIENKRWPSNVLLATNMISVGIDVARLNVMLLVGQPKLTSEYIQASSRVGREFPGVAFAMYDGSKSRDRSHYEQFRGYHDSFYRHVEPTGVTPFSRPARERALHAVVISLIRQLVPDLTSEKMARQFNRNEYADEIELIKSYLVNRCNSVTSRVNAKMVSEADVVGQEIEALLEHWETIAGEFTTDEFYYGEKFMMNRPEQGQGRLMKAYNSDRNDQTAFDTMTSMRNVDVTVASSIVLWEEPKNGN